jgi:soluble lytic murein transglycosylase-like protein
MATIIDALLVTLGLDASEYKKAEAEAAKATEGTAAKVSNAQKKSAQKRKPIDDEQRKRTRDNANEEKKRADATVKGFKDMAVGAAGLILGFDSIKGFIGLLGTLNSSEAGLGRLGANLGINTHELNTWGLAAERMGGKAEDIQGSFANVSKSITELAVNAQVSPLFLLAQRMGVDIRGITDKTKFLLDLGDKLRDYGAKHGRDNAFNVSGLDATTFNLITADDARKRLAEAEKANHVSEETAKAAAASQAKIEALKQRASNVGRDLAHTLVPGAVDLANGVMTATDHQLNALNAAAHGDGSIAWNEIKRSFGHGVVDDRSEIDAALLRSEQYHGLPTGLLSTIAQTESNFDPRAHNKKSGAEGLMQLMPQQFGGDVGKDTFKDIDTAAKELQRLLKHYGGDVVQAAEAYNWGQGNMDHYNKGDINPKTGRKYEMPQETVNYGARVAATPGLVRNAPGSNGATAGATNNTNNGATVNIDAINIHTAQANAEWIAKNISSAVTRQMATAQANTGTTQ